MTLVSWGLGGSCHEDLKSRLPAGFRGDVESFLGPTCDGGRFIPRSSSAICFIFLRAVTALIATALYTEKGTENLYWKYLRELFATFVIKFK